MASVVARDGLAKTTIANVAAAAGLQRTLVLHYFGDRRGLMEAFINEAVAVYGERMLLVDGTEPIETRLDRLFEPGAYQRRDDLVIWTDLVAQSARDEVVRQRLHDLWTHRWFPEIERQLATARPHAQPAQVTQVAYALACLVEAHWAFHLQGLDDTLRRQQAQQAARTLLATLPD
ncbi:TetR/AcrR family transcriptional regulator [Nocardia barduliensis]|uniref:TetR/AcrR family transcriptional regulator n=1 Tax=Nocardia barduliensis TaxID=2736643 RepID=UPI001FE6D653|nr:TetR/AcrR family transcriptional regulator [Nocardia barduliensis]